MLNDILTAIPLGILLAFTIGPVFFVLLEISITKGFRAAMVFDLGVITADLIFILIAYFSTNQLLEKLNIQYETKNLSSGIYLLKVNMKNDFYLFKVFID